MKFKVGDRVIFRSEMWADHSEIGTVAIIVTSQYTKYPYRVALDSWFDNEYLFLCKEEELELIE